jgi:sugar lactone lactonase YvrE
MRRILLTLALLGLAPSCGDDASNAGADGESHFRWDKPDKVSDKDAKSTGNDKDPYFGECEDEDGDKFGPGCLAGPDCDDSNSHLNIYCPPCESGIYEGCECSNEGSSIACYPGEPDYLGIGECVAGQQTCTEGYWTGCLGYKEPEPEFCDGKDNNCDGVTDDGVLSPCGDCNVLCDNVGAGPGEEKEFVLDEDNSSGVDLNVDGYIVLDSTKVNMQFIWIANSGEGTVSKLKTTTGQEEGRYIVCSDPSRTSVDLYGDVWVGCRGDGGVAKILVHELMCTDANGNGVIDTSRDTNGNGHIEGGEMLPGGQDECIKFIVHPGGSCTRAVGVDKENHAWVGEWNASMLRRLHPDDGHTVQEIAIPANPYGLVIDEKGVIWVSGRGGSILIRADPANGNVTSLSPGGGYDPYGITLDYKGRVWTANCCGNTVAWRYDPQNGQWNSAGVHNRPRGLVGSLDGFVYVANDESNEVAIVNADSLNTLGYVSLGGGRFPIGMTIDFDGFVWAVNQSASSACKIDAKAMTVIGEYSTGSSPYTYSDMTGYLLHTFTNPTGFYRHLFGGWGLRLRWTAVIVDAYLPSGTYLKIRVRSGVTEADLEAQPWSEFFGPFPPATFPLDLLPLNLTGHFLQVEVSLFASQDGTTPIVKSIEVKFDKGQGGD